jgi:glycosyltransferase involved in cell wall biosynthesis
MEADRGTTAADPSRSRSALPHETGREWRPLRIAQIAPLYERVPPGLYGGTERVVSYLTEHLVALGHRVTLFASGDSRTRARLVAPVPRALRLDADVLDPLAPHVLELAQAFDRADEFDVIHCHIDYLAFPFAHLVSTPTVHTMHGRLDLPYLRPLLRHFADVPLISISDAQRAPVTNLDLNWIGTVHHGLPLERIPVGSGGGGYLAFIGRISPEKRLDLAIEVATRAGLRLRVAAKVDAVDRTYFEAEIAPLLRHPLVDFLGEIGEADKPAFLGEARALLFPVDWPEPFGLAMIEALACGTPVVARPRGAVGEVLRHGQTGFLANTVEELAAAVGAVDRIDRATCRREAETRFSVARMARDYEAIFTRQIVRNRVS